MTWFFLSFLLSFFCMLVSILAKNSSMENSIMEYRKFYNESIQFLQEIQFEESNRSLCCHGIQCLQKPANQSKYAILMTLRSEDYLYFLQNLICSLGKSNPKIPILIAMKYGEIRIQTLHAIKYSSRNQINFIYWEDISFVNHLRNRYSLNWIKIRAWEMIEYDGLLMIDVDTVVLEDISHLFLLPTHFAAVLDEDKLSSQTHSSLGNIQGGVLFLRPCRSIAQDMISLLNTYPQLQFPYDHAEQSFFDWYFKYDKWSLPVEYNAIAHLLIHPNKTHYVTRGGIEPKIVHFTRKYIPLLYKCDSKQ